MGPARRETPLDRALHYPEAEGGTTDEAQSDVQRRAVAVPHIANAQDASPPLGAVKVRDDTSPPVGQCPRHDPPRRDGDATWRSPLTVPQALVLTPEHRRCVRVGPWIHSGSSER
jgi:hypothetical protein